MPSSPFFKTKCLFVFLTSFNDFFCSRISYTFNIPQIGILSTMESIILEIGGYIFINYDLPAVVYARYLNQDIPWLQQER